MRIQLFSLTALVAVSGCSELDITAGEAAGYAAAAQMVSGCYEERTEITDFYAPDAPDYHYHAISEQLEKQGRQTSKICFKKGDQVRMLNQMIEQTKQGKCAGSELSFSGAGFSGDFSCTDRSGKDFDMKMEGEMTKDSMKIDMVLAGDLYSIGPVERTSTTTWKCIEKCGTY
ncbi:DUF3617 family protein [Erythrobacter sp. MTPC3]|uniref:DUF3617 family protein n=1 Tax=Erythrobacter sp. MTPC3 TaxID=3056564 RepID=UPI0036F1FDB1